MEIIFQNCRQYARHGQSRPVQRVNEFWFPVGIAETNPSPTRLKCFEVRTTRDFQLTRLARGPDFEIVFFGLGEPEVAAAHQQYAVREFELLQQILRVCPQSI